MSSIIINRLIPRIGLMVGIIVFMFLEDVSAQDVYFDLGFMGSYSKISVQSAITKPKTLFQFGGGATVGYLIDGNRNFFIGATTDYRRMNQYSNTSVGNISGTRWNMVSPTLGYYNNTFAIKGDVQFLGDHRLKIKGLNGEDVAYTSPIGWRFAFLYSFVRKVYGNIFVEEVSFKYLKVGDVKTQLASTIKFWQYGLGINFIF